jgi:hypothetical protein
MKTRPLALALAVTILCSCASGQWVATSCSAEGSAPSVSMIGPHLYAGTVSNSWDGVLLRSNDEGIHWDTLATWPAGLKTAWYKRWEILCLIDSVLVAEVLGSGLGDRNVHHLVRSVDGGYTWVDTVETERVSGLFSIDSRVFAITYGPVIRSSSNYGQTWDAGSHPGLPNDYVSGVLVMDSLLFFSTLNNGVFRSSNQGTSWVPASSGLSGGPCGSLARIGDTLYCQVDSGVAPYLHTTAKVFRSANGGTSWTDASNGLSGTTGYSSLWSHLGFLFCETSSGLFRSTNLGASWELWGQGLPPATQNSMPTVYSMAFSETSVFAAVDGGVWKRALNDISTSTQSAGQLPDAFMLCQNYPNPFNPSTTIRYGLRSRGHVTLTVFNTLGQQVSVLQNGEQEAGYHEVQFNAQNLPSGVYFYRWQAGFFTETKRLLLLR